MLITIISFLLVMFAFLIGAFVEQESWKREIKYKFATCYGVTTLLLFLFSLGG
ncbi:hypothetical protein J2Z37_005039 [Ammoniphilus resinae]|uniref:Uncharacterized protein n=1 Tax=Ammoniphilus resinae TaxID=861532 RepID=A0ABS4GXN2_9BACL|nr:hypothetical protein [Ammoniphilus resinae]